MLISKLFMDTTQRIRETTPRRTNTMECHDQASPSSSISRRSTRMIVNVVISSATWGLGLSNLWFSRARHPTTYRGQLDASTMNLSELSLFNTYILLGLDNPCVPAATEEGAPVPVRWPFRWVAVAIRPEMAT